MRCNIHDFDIMEEGISIGEERGRSEAKLEAARNMLALNVLSHEQIAQVVELPLETVQQLARFAETEHMEQV